MHVVPTGVSELIARDNPPCLHELAQVLLGRHEGRAEALGGIGILIAVRGCSL